jgi:hypothetical protein
MRDELLTAALLPTALQWQNREANPPDPTPGTSFLREIMTPVSEVLNAYNNQQVNFIVAYQIFVVTGDGTENLGAIQKAIGDVFLPGTWISTIPDCPFHVVRTERGPLVSSTKTQTWASSAVNVICRAHYNVPVTP